MDCSLTITPAHEGMRLDRVLSELSPGASLRHRRRLVEQQRVLVDGTVRAPGYKVRAGEVVRLALPGKPEAPAGVRVVSEQGEYAAVSKPAGVHSADVAGSSEPNVERLLPELFPVRTPLLLNRLDGPTSGFLLVAFSGPAAERFRELERAGAVEKEYLAVVRGELAGQRVVAARLDMAYRQRVRVLGEEDPDPARHTRLTPLSHDPAAATTLVRAVIRRGARHQIRAHLAGIGHPIVGDDLYGDGESGPLLLHHRRVEFEGFCAELEPPW